MNKEERDALLERNEASQMFNYYKSAGAKLLEKNMITPEQYHNQVRTMGITLGAIDPNNKDIPENIDNNDNAKLGLEIGGAVAGSLLWGGARLAHPLGWVGYIAQQSLASGGGAALGNIVYNKIMGAPQATSDNAIKDAMSTGTEVAGFNAAFMAGLPVAGKMAKLGYQGAKLGLAGVGAGAKMIPGVTQGMTAIRNGMNKYAASENAFANQLLKTAEERGIVLSNAMVANPTIRGIMEAFSRTPFIGTPLRESYEKSLKSVANSLMDDVSSGATLDQAAAKFSNRFKFDEATNKYVLNQKAGYAPDEINLEAYVKLLNQADDYTKGYSKQLDNMFGIFTKGQSKASGSATTAISAAMAKGNINFGSLQAWWNRIGEAGSQGRYPPELKAFFKKLDGGKKISPFELKRLFNDMNKVERDLLNRVDGAYADDLYRNFDEARTALNNDIMRGLNRNESTIVKNQLDNLTKSRAEQLNFLGKADDTGMLSATNIVFREGGEFADKLNNAMRNSFLVKSGGGKTYSELLKRTQDGDFFVLPGSTTEAVRRAAGKYKDAGYEEILTKLYKQGGTAQHRNLIDLIGQKQYAKLAQGELDDIFDSTIIDYLNRGGGNGRQLFLEKIGAAGTATEMAVAKDRMQLILKNLNEARKTQTATVNGKTAPLKEITWDNLRDYGSLLQFLPERPALNQFIQRSMALKLAGGISAGTITGFVGVGGMAAAGGPLAGLATGMSFRLLSAIMAKPYKYDNVVSLLKNAPTNPEARKKLYDYMEQEAGPLAKIFNGHYLRKLQENDPTFLKAARMVAAPVAADTINLTEEQKQFGSLK